MRKFRGATGMWMGARLKTENDHTSVYALKDGAHRFVDAVRNIATNPSHVVSDLQSSFMEYRVRVA
jgi:hypothetical protein